MRNKTLQKIGKLISENQDQIPVLSNVTVVDDSVISAGNYRYAMKLVDSDRQVSFFNTEARLAFFEDALLDGKRPAVIAIDLDKDHRKISLYLSNSLHSNDLSLEHMNFIATLPLKQVDMHDLKEASVQDVEPEVTVTHKFAYYAGKLVVSDSKDYGDLVNEISDSLDMEPNQLEMSDIAVGDIVDNGEMIRHKQIVNSSIQSDTNKAIKDWFSPKKAKKENPDYQFVFYNGALKVVEYKHNNRPKKLFEDLLREHGYDKPATMQQDFDNNKTASGNIYLDNDTPIVEHKQLSDVETQENAAKAIDEYFENELQKHNSGEWSTLNPDMEYVDPWLSF